MPQRGDKASLATRSRGGWVLRKRYGALALHVSPGQDQSRLVYVVRVRNTDSGDWATLVKTGRIAARMSQQALADAIDVSRSTVVRWERNIQKPENPEVVGRLAKVIREDHDRLMRAAGLALAGEAGPEPDPRLRGLDPNHPTVRRIMSLNVTEETRTWMLDRQRQLEAARVQQDIADLELLAQRDQRGGEEGRVA